MDGDDTIDSAALTASALKKKREKRRKHGGGRDSEEKKEDDGNDASTRETGTGGLDRRHGRRGDDHGGDAARADGAATQVIGRVWNVMLELVGSGNVGSADQDGDEALGGQDGIDAARRMRDAANHSQKNAKPLLAAAAVAVAVGASYLYHGSGLFSGASVVLSKGSGIHCVANSHDIPAGKATATIANGHWTTKTPPAILDGHSACDGSKRTLMCPPEGRCFGGFLVDCLADFGYLFEVSAVNFIECVLSAEGEEAVSYLERTVIDIISHRLCEGAVDGGEDAGLVQYDTNDLYFVTIDEIKAVFDTDLTAVGLSDASLPHLAPYANEKVVKYLPFSGRIGLTTSFAKTLVSDCRPAPIEKKESTTLNRVQEFTTEYWKKKWYGEPVPLPCFSNTTGARLDGHWSSKKAPAQVAKGYFKPECHSANSTRPCPEHARCFDGYIVDCDADGDGFFVVDEDAFVDCSLSTRAEEALDAISKKLVELGAEKKCDVIRGLSFEGVVPSTVEEFVEVLCEEPVGESNFCLSANAVEMLAPYFDSDIVEYSHSDGRIGLTSVFIENQLDGCLPATCRRQMKLAVSAIQKKLIELFVENKCQEIKRLIDPNNGGAGTDKILVFSDVGAPSVPVEDFVGALCEDAGDEPSFCLSTDAVEMLAPYFDSNVVEYPFDGRIGLTSAFFQSQLDEHLPPACWKQIALVVSAIQQKIIELAVHHRCESIMRGHRDIDPAKWYYQDVGYLIELLAKDATALSLSVDDFHLLSTYFDQSVIDFDARSGRIGLAADFVEAELDYNLPRYCKFQKRFPVKIFECLLVFFGTTALEICCVFLVAAIGQKEAIFNIFGKIELAAICLLWCFVLSFGWPHWGDAIIGCALAFLALLISCYEGIGASLRIGACVGLGLSIFALTKNAVVIGYLGAYATTMVLKKRFFSKFLLTIFLGNIQVDQK